MIEKLAQFTDIRSCLIVGGLSTKVSLVFQFHDAFSILLGFQARMLLPSIFHTVAYYANISLISLSKVYYDLGWIIAKNLIKCFFNQLYS